MIEIVLGVWGVCLILSMILTGIYIYTLSRKFKSSSLQNLNRNLRQANLFWSHSQHTFKKIDEESSELQDKQRTLKHAALMGLLGFLSLPGLTLLVAIIGSSLLFSASRKENLVFTSALTTNSDLSGEEVQSLVQEIEQSF